MTEQEQEEQYAKLLVDERRTEKKLACLESKIRETKEALDLVFMILRSSQPSTVSQAVEKYAEIRDTDIGVLIREKETTLTHLYTVRDEIRAIEGRSSPR